MPRTATPLEPLIDTIEAAEALDAVAKPIAQQARGVLKPGALKDAISGTWLGHAVHPVLTDVVIGSFLSATILDALGENGTAGEKLIGVGLVAYAPTALTGVNDWADTEPASDGVRRAGIVHAATNAVAMSFYAASLAARRRGRRGTGAALGAAGATLLMAGGYLGGHLTLTRGVGADQTVFDPGPEDWTPAADASVLPENRPTRVVVDETPVLLLKQENHYYAIHDRCSHRGCSLSGGEIQGHDVVCACHGSTFDLRDGSVQRGPATAPQPAFETRVSEGRVEVRRRA
jgi:nitrite reductase/ring-hydroxylating ferredoxin subunit/uncharacterized membrane protein